MDYEQEYLKHEYLELRIPAARDVLGQPTFAIDPNHLHIWPRHSFMLIALANQVHSIFFPPSFILFAHCQPHLHNVG
jgi:kynurenine 3-monooxygenase